jgi:hypothetical protein
MKWIVVKLSGDAARPRLRNRRRHDHDRGPRPSARQRQIFIKDDETGTGHRAGQARKGGLQAR